MIVLRRIAVFAGISCLSLLASVASIADASNELSVKLDSQGGGHTFFHADSPLLSYKSEKVQVPDGVEGVYALPRSGYIHPIYGFNGEMLTSDFPPDHPHHRGIYWAWPEISHGGETFDLHALQGVRSKPDGVVESGLNTDSAWLRHNNIWVWQGDRAILREQVFIRAHRPENGMRVFDLNLKFRAIVPGIEIARRNRDSYGGLNVRLSPRNNQSIRKVFNRDDPYSIAWAELVGVPEGEDDEVGVLMLQSPMNPHYPCEWISYPEINWLQPAFPASGKRYRIDPEDPLLLSYRIVVRSGQGLDQPIESIYAGYLRDIIGSIWDCAAHEMGDDISALREFEKELRGMCESRRVRAEKTLLLLLEHASPSDAMKVWICDQLALVGGRDSIAYLVGLLSDEAWMSAADALSRIPLEISPRALADNIAGLSPKRRAAILAILAQTAIDAAGKTIIEAAEDKDPAARRAAIEALGSLASPEAAMQLNRLEVESGDLAVLHDAKIRVALDLHRIDSHPDLTRELLLSVWTDPSAGRQARSGAMQGLATLDYENIASIVEASLEQDCRVLRNGAIATLRILSDSRLQMLEPGFESYSVQTQQAFLREWGRRGSVEAGRHVLNVLKTGCSLARRAAIESAMALELQDAVGPLFNIALGEDQLAQHARDALDRMPGEDVDGHIKKIAGSAQGAHSLLAVEILISRLGPGSVEVLLDLIGGDDENVERAVFAAIRNHGTPDHLPQLRALLISSANDLKPELARSMVGICRRQDDPQQQLGSVLAAEPELGPGERSALLDYMHAVGGAPAADFAAARIDAESIRTLGRWPDRSAAEHLVRAVESHPYDDEIVRAAVAAYSSLAQRVLAENERLEGLRRMADSIENDDLRREIEQSIEEIESGE